MKFWTIVLTMNDVEAEDEDEAKQKVIDMGLPNWIEINEIFDNNELTERLKAIRSDN